MKYLAVQIGFFKGSQGDWKGGWEILENHNGYLYIDLEYLSTKQGKLAVPM